MQIWIHSEISIWSDNLSDFDEWVLNPLKVLSDIRREIGFDPKNMKYEAKIEKQKTNKNYPS